MATGKVTVSLDETAWTFAEQAAAGMGMSAAAWISRAVRRESVRTLVGSIPGSEDVASLYETEQHWAEEAVRAAG